MKRAKPYNFDPFSVMSYHDLTQEARRLRRANRKLRSAIRFRANEESDSDTFVLENAPPKTEPWRGNESENTRQTVLLTGMDCRPGQQNLFETDGDAASTPENQ
ncbi:MAG: hypothetical protein IT426_20845 [Pirellulales bacterium]|nr:hypothetical protein [Pirellulales bacterium]